MIWHETLGVESNTDILLSPTHIGLFIGLIMSVTAPLWSAWPDAKSGTSGWSSQLLLVFGAGAAWSVVQLIFRYTNLWFRGLADFCYSGSTDFCHYESYTDALEFGLQGFWLQALLLSGACSVLEALETRSRLHVHPLPHPSRQHVGVFGIQFNGVPNEPLAGHCG